MEQELAARGAVGAEAREAVRGRARGAADSEGISSAPAQVGGSGSSGNPEVVGIVQPRLQASVRLPCGNQETRWGASPVVT